MESRILILVLALVFYEYALYFIMFFLALEIYKKYVKQKRFKSYDKASLELLYLLSSEQNINEKTISRLMGVVGLNKWSKIYERSGKLKFPVFGWRSRTVSLAIKSCLGTGNNEILTNALEQISKQEEYETESASLLSSQKYTLMASLVVSSAVLGIVSTMTGDKYLWYVISQAIITGVWLSFFEGKFYESLSFSVPSSVLAYLLSIRFV